MVVPGSIPSWGKPAEPASPPVLQVLKCILSEGMPRHVVVDNHACMRQVFTAVFLSSPDEKNSHPIAKVEIHSLFALPYEVNEKYELVLRPVKT
jgi:hypothetical protein